MSKQQYFQCGKGLKNYHEESEHCLANVETVPPVVIGDVTVTLANGVHPPCQSLGKRVKTTNSVYSFSDVIIPVIW